MMEFFLFLLMGSFVNYRIARMIAMEDGAFYIFIRFRIWIGRKFKGKDSVPWGGSDGLESNYVRCKQCGFIVNRKVNTPGSGWGNVTTEAITTIAGGTANARNPISTAGCPFCNSSEFE